ncbi:MAG: zinc ABC transporter substrate-binding protein [Bacilli bacterium]|jgi:zinc transport system substrate-binding protein|nr:zinc ABC transporter substrate-binding protein [Bacilli bacterium]
MKKIKILTIALLSVFLLTGCFKRDNLDDITIYTTTYPIEYLTKYIYGYNSNVLSIYPKGTNPREYTLTDKKIKEYANSDMLIYNGETKEKNIAASFMNKNKHLKIIDVSKGLTVKRDEEELWLCPSNYLMLAQNIKNELLEYTSSTLLKQEINDNYDKLKLIISSYDAELKVIAESSSNPTIVAANDVFKFLEKYGFKVLSIEENDLANPAELNEAKNNIKNKLNSYIFILNTDTINDLTKSLENEGAIIANVQSMINLTDEEYKDGYDYEQMMDTFIETIKTEVYN